MTPLVPLAAGLVALVAAWLVLRSIGPGYRIGRLLATTPRASVDEAIRLAVSGRPRYLRVDGRIDAIDEFEDADHRPLVFRRTRIQARQTGRWSTVDDGRESVPFTVNEGLQSIVVDADALDDGLVVVPRESIGVASDAPDRVPAGLDPATPVRALIEQVSSVEHAIVLGVPVVGDDGPPQMTAGMGRPLVLTTLEPDEAIRILAGSADRPRLAGLLLAVGALLEVVAVIWWVAGVVFPGGVAAASPSPGGVGGDPRSSGEGPGLVGQPLLAIGAVVAIAIVALLLTLAYVRLTGGPADEGPSRRP